MQVDVESLTNRQFTDLFLVCVKNDSFKLALHIYLRFLQRVNMTLEVMSKIMI